MLLEQVPYVKKFLGVTLRKGTRDSVVDIDPSGLSSKRFPFSENHNGQDHEFVAKTGRVRNSIQIEMTGIDSLTERSIRIACIRCAELRGYKNGQDINKIVGLQGRLKWVKD